MKNCPETITDGPHHHSMTTEFVNPWSDENLSSDGKIRCQSSFDVTLS